MNSSDPITGAKSSEEDFDLDVWKSIAKVQRLTTLKKHQLTNASSIEDSFSLTSCPLLEFHLDVRNALLEKLCYTYKSSTMKIQLISTLAVTTFYWLCLCQHKFVASGQCLNDQKSLLLQFKNNVTFTSTADLSNSRLKQWNASDDCCIWLGVSCDQQGYITGLDLSVEPISGVLDDSNALFSLQHLQSLILSHTNFTGVFPHTVGNLSNLSELDLSYCGFNGKIPNSLSNLTKLSYLVLPNNMFTGPTTSFGMPKNLMHLDLSGNYLNGTIPLSHFQGLHNLVHVDLSNNSFTGSIPSSLFKLPSLQELQLSHNKFSQLDEFINVTLPRLELLHIFVNNLSGRIPPFLFMLPQLKFLELDHNQFSHIDEFLNVSCSVLRILDLSSNNLSGSFPTSILQLTTLSVLRLSSNKFNGLVELNKIFNELKHLTELDLSYNNFSVNASVTHDDPSSFPRITDLFLATCNLNKIPAFLRNMSTLASLDISDNQIGGIVPNWIWKTYFYINISHNLFTHLEGPLQNLTANLFVLDLHHNKLQGSMPPFPEQVQYVDYSNNKFSSIIPQDIGNYLSSILFLSLSNNTLYGSIPDSLCNASNVKVLDLSLNNISGTIPTCLIMMSGTLEILNLKNNNLSGPIPDRIPTSCDLWTLNLHGNLLDGPIPQSLAHCSKLEVLDLGFNQIIGSFPCFLKEISALRILVLRNNKLQGSISCSKGNKTWEMLQIMDIAFNKFSGKLPGKYFTTWKRKVMPNESEAGSKLIEKQFKFYGDFYYQDSVTVTYKGLQLEFVKILTFLTSIDFSSNNFDGPIPDDLMDFRTLCILNLSNNALFGEIPSSIGNLKLLESLDLSQNSLSGKIPLQLASLSFLSYLNLSFNHLVGKIPTGTQIQTFPASSFEGNDKLYGPPLTKEEDGNESRILPQQECERIACTIDWNFISVELGLIFGHGIVFFPVLIWKRWRVWYWELIHKILCWIFPRIYLQYATQRGKTYVTLRWWHG
ncbi:hypothetical protein VNO78_25627 [Psophocarpus tetragonolobus]|uniref:Leucine-rich repeat-containing N-terminal plant-type domain-containing protein n=1 Tax=Psophocarpus tetragonolobus TaxID=3891 RepID=A0AAN9S9X6_PSOTE